MSEQNVPESTPSEEEKVVPKKDTRTPEELDAIIEEAKKPKPLGGI